ncbi:hypothetical protein AMJ86_10335, partial [bacterium SM23_57]
TEINAQLLGKNLDVLFEDKVKGRWRGRTPTNKLVFVESDEDIRGLIRPVTITWTGPWSMQGRLSHSLFDGVPSLRFLQSQKKSINTDI